MKALDKTDRQIIMQLGSNARMSSREISKHLEYSEVTIRTRLKRLLEQGYISCTAVTNTDYYQNPVQAFIWIEVDHAENKEHIMDELAQLDEITFVSSLLGRADILAMTLVNDVSQLVNYLRKTIGEIKGVHRVQYSLSHKVLKLDLSRVSLI